MFFSRQFFPIDQVPKGTTLPGSCPQRHSAGILSASSEAKAVHCIVYEWNHKSWNVRREGTVCFHSHTTHREQPPEVPILQATPRCDLYSGAPSSSCAPERSLGSYKGLSTSPSPKGTGLRIVTPDNPPLCHPEPASFRGGLLGSRSNPFFIP